MLRPNEWTLRKYENPYLEQKYGKKSLGDNRIAGRIKITADGK
jgi:hypothetical protein